MPEPYLPEFEDLLRQHLDAGLELQDLAEVLDVNAPTLSRWLRGRRSAPDGLADRIRRVLPQAVQARKRKLREQIKGLDS